MKEATRESVKMGLTLALFVVVFVWSVYAAVKTGGTTMRLNDFIAGETQSPR